MDLRHEKRKRNHILGILIIPAFLCAVVAAVLLLTQFPAKQASAADLGFGSVENIDSRAKAASPSIFSALKGQNAADEFSYQIKEKLIFEKASAEGKLLLTNPLQNRYLMALELAVGDDEEVVLRTGYILPGQMIEAVTLDEKLSAGEYQATADICAVDPKTYELLGIIEQPIKLTIKS